MVHAAVHDEFLARAVRGLVAGEEQRHVGDVDRLTDASERDVAFCSRCSRTNVGIGERPNSGGHRRFDGGAAAAVGLTHLHVRLAPVWHKIPSAVSVYKISNSRSSTDVWLSHYRVSPINH
jgi:hypothetical protein